MTRFDSHRRQRHSIRLKHYDYAEAGAYFVTVCTCQRESLFGEIAGGTMAINRYGEIARACWLAIPQHFPNVDLDSYIIMPNHMHGILVITDRAHPVGARPVAQDLVGAHPVGAQHAAPLQKPQQPPPQNPPQTPLHDPPSTPRVQPGSLGAILRSFKSAVTKQVNAARDTAGAPVWQRNYYEHIIRTERELNAIRQYIADNPANWYLDVDNPSNVTHMSAPRTIEDYVHNAGTREART